MEEKMNLTQEEALQISLMFPLEPMFNKVVVTLNVLEPDSNLVLSDNEMAQDQFVIAKGPMAHGVDVNDKVMLDLEKMTVKEPDPNNAYDTISRIKIDPIYIEDRVYAIIEDRHIKGKYINQPVIKHE